jgi:hypothetical protein
LDDLPVPVKDLKTTKRFPPSLRGTIYEAMLEAVSEELSVWRETIKEQKTSFYDVDRMSLDRLIEISRTFGVPFAAFVKNDIFFLREEVRTIPFKIYYKGTPTLYKSFFYAVDRYGEMFIYTYQADVNDIVRLMLDPFDDAVITPQNLPFRHRSRGDFSGSIENWLKLDSELYLDAGDALWRLDTSSISITTNHIGFEYFIDRIITRNDKNIVTGEESQNDYLMTREYLDYLNQSVEFARRAKEVPHPGSQLSIQTDVSGLCNSYDPSSEFSIPALKLKAAARSDFFSLVNSAHDITHVEFGIGKQNIASVQNPEVVFPENLAAKVCSVPIRFKDQFTNSYYTGAVGEYLGQSLNGFRLLDGSAFDGAQQNFTFSLPFAPIQRGNITLEFHLPTDEVLAVSDDRRGSLLSLYGSGTIDYKTGACQLTTKFNYTQMESMEPILRHGQPDPADGRRHFIHTLTGGKSVIPGSVWMIFTAGEDRDQKTCMVNDTPDSSNSSIGNFIHPFIQSGVIDYSAKTIDVIFTFPLVDPAIKPFNCKYAFPVDYTLPAGTVLLASCFFTQQSILVTEAGFRNKEGILLNYVTFPPLEFNSTAYHLDLLVLVKNPSVL